MTATLHPFQSTVPILKELIRYSPEPWVVHGPKNRIRYKDFNSKFFRASNTKNSTKNDQNIAPISG
jgi:hypothetical protein